MGEQVDVTTIKNTLREGAALCPALLSFTPAQRVWALCPVATDSWAPRCSDQLRDISQLRAGTGTRPRCPIHENPSCGETGLHGSAPGTVPLGQLGEARLEALALWLCHHVLLQRMLGGCQWNKIRPQVTVPRNINSSVVGKRNVLYINKSSMTFLVHAEKPFDKIKYPLRI